MTKKYFILTCHSKSLSLVFLAFSAPIPANAEGRENWLPEVAIFASLLEKYETFQIQKLTKLKHDPTLPGKAKLTSCDIFKILVTLEAMSMDELPGYQSISS